MNPEQTFALAVECGAERAQKHNKNDSRRVYITYTVLAHELLDFATRIAEQAIAEHLAKLQGDWLRSGDLLYRPGEGQSVLNKDMIQVMMVDGSYETKKRADAAAVLHKLLDVALPAKQQQSAAVLPVVERYDLVQESETLFYMELSSNGDYVRYDDFKAAIAAGGAK